MMKNSSPVAFLCVLFVLFLAGACRDKTNLDGVTIPRLMIESRGAGGYSGPSSYLLRLPVSGTVVAVEREPVINEFEINNVELVKVDLGMALLLQVSAEGSRKLYRASVSGMGGRIVLTINGKPVGARRIDSAISDGNFFTFVEMPDEELEALVVDLKESVIKLQTNLAERR